MIPRRELDDLRGEWSLDIGVIEKDYVLGWLLAGIAAHPELAATWIFKGGTCLRKCYYETFRFSEDLDFTVIDDGPEESTDLQRIFADVGEWLQEEAGIELVLDDNAFRRRHNRRGHPTTQGRISYRGPNPTRGVLPKVKFDITSDEILTQPATLRPLGHQYSDQPLPVRGVASYPITELFGESCARWPSDAAHAISTTSCTCTAIPTSWDAPPPSSQCYNANANTPASTSPHWSRSATPGSATRSSESGRTCSAINSLDRCRRSTASGRPSTTCSDGSPVPAHHRTCPAHNSATSIRTGQRRAITTWRRGFPLELLRYAGANRLRVEIDYRPEQGRSGPRIVEPYSLRRTSEGNIVLLVINDRRQLRSYRIDRIAAIKPTTQTFTPIRRVEF